MLLFISLPEGVGWFRSEVFKVLLVLFSRSICVTVLPFYFRRDYSSSSLSSVVIPNIGYPLSKVVTYECCVFFVQPLAASKTLASCPGGNATPRRHRGDRSPKQKGYEFERSDTKTDFGGVGIYLSNGLADYSVRSDLALNARHCEDIWIDITMHQSDKKTITSKHLTFIQIK